MYEKQKEKEYMLSKLKEVSQPEIKYTREQNLHRAINFALEEVDEIEKAHRKFLDSIQHLVVYQEGLQEHFLLNSNKTLENMRYFIEKNYTKEDKESMPEDVLNQVRANQERRLMLLKKVARQYLSRQNS